MKTFNYASTSAVKENLTYLILGAALIVFPLVHPFGIRIGAKPVLGPLPTTILLIIAGLYMLYTAYRKIRQARALSAKGGVITVDNDRVTYPVIRKGQVETETFSISEISNISYDEEDGILTVTLGGGREAKFDLDFFDSPQPRPAQGVRRAAAEVTTGAIVRDPQHGGSRTTVPAAPAVFFCF